MNQRYLNYDERFIITYKKYLKPLIAYLRTKVVFDQYIAEDVAHEMFLKIYEKKLDLDPFSDGILHYLYVVAKNSAIDFMLKENRHETKIKEAYIEEVTLDKSFYKNIEDCVIEGEVVSTLHDTINSFPEKEKLIFIRHNLYRENTASVVRATDLSRFLLRRIERKISWEIKMRLKGYFTEE